MKTEKNIKLGHYIKRARKEKGLSQKEMASLLGISQSRYSNYENGHNSIPKIILDEISKILNEDLEIKKRELEELSNLSKKENNFFEGFKYQFEQRIFGESLMEIRVYIDSIDNKRKRRTASIELANTLDALLEEWKGREKQEEI